MKASGRQRAVLIAASLALAAIAVYRWQSVRVEPAAATSPLLDPRRTADLQAGTTPQSSDAALLSPDLAPLAETDLAQPDLLPAVAAALAETSLRGTQPDGALRFGDDGRLQVDAELRRHVEWWLSLLGEMPLPEIRQLLLANLQARDAAESAQVIEFFDQWVDYLRDADSRISAGDTHERLEALSALRRRWFGDDAQALFGEEEDYTRSVLARQEALRDPNLTSEERRAALTAAEASLNPEQVQMRSASRDPLLASEQTAQFDSLNTQTAQRHSERAALWGDAAADRLAELDQQQALWETRLLAFRNQRTQILQTPELAPAQRQAQIDALLQRDFSPAEARRAQAMVELPQDALEPAQR